ncbi:MAG: hypothetical protein IOC80_04305 [Rhodobacter sp.]|nr:hypothetical protein [Rhodobacter sp.]MCA3526425.1 hypothetical protein [Rhodobacter sp.]MCA3529635.1 hypothetical protein [Rhodobacter sp.]MCA3531505.1 hypothetical protein [Rhodobacter sp.]MCA3536121.1 hypothetical protein [Rhodobacter sp.]
MKTIEALFADWRAKEAYAARPEISDDEAHKACDAANALVREMLGVPAVSAADLARKLIAFTADGAFEAGPASGPGSDALWTEIRRLAGVA